jgi:hypothetical protein
MIAFQSLFPDNSRLFSRHAHRKAISHFSSCGLSGGGAGLESGTSRVLACSSWTILRVNPRRGVVLALAFTFELQGPVQGLLGFVGPPVGGPGSQEQQSEEGLHLNPQSAGWFRMTGPPN